MNLSWLRLIGGKSIRRQLVTGIALVYLVLMAVFVSVLVVRERSFLREKVRSRAQAQADLLAVSCRNGLMANDVAAIQEIVQSMRKHRGVNFAMILDARGQVVAHTDDSRVGLFVEDPTSKSLLSSEPKPAVLAEAGRRLDVAAPIHAGGRMLGWARVERDMSEDADYLRFISLYGAAFTLLAILVGTLIASRVARTILRPLDLLLEGTQRISQNQLDYRIPITTENEVGIVSAAFNAGLDQLSRQISERQRAEENLRSQAREIIASANTLSAAATTILSSVSDLVGNASQTATAVSETTVTVEELRQTAQLSTQKAKLVAESSQKAAQFSASGRESTAESAEGMKRIRKQMESIAESMVHLSDQTQAIGQIIATVDDLAAQSNLLAVNAAIEAAKAGEQGKGFGVVAQEVKSLAEQSKQATGQVRAILNDIQKAAAVAALATEQGSKAVESGVRQTAQAGESIQGLADSVTESAQSAAQISATSQQQFVGMDQVASAMEGIKQASTHNVDNARRLETAARALSKLGEQLKELVARYRV